MEAGAASDWQVHDDGYGNLYYHNTVTGETQWEPPPGMEPAEHATVVDVPHGTGEEGAADISYAVEQEFADWARVWDPTASAFYYYNNYTHEVTYTQPTEYDASAGNQNSPALNAVIRLQCFARAKNARAELARRWMRKQERLRMEEMKRRREEAIRREGMSAVMWIKLWEPAQQRWYYYNKDTRAVTFEEPPGYMPGVESVEVEAAVRIQTAFRALAARTAAMERKHKLFPHLETPEDIRARLRREQLRAEARKKREAARREREARERRALKKLKLEEQRRRQESADAARAAEKVRLTERAAELRAYMARCAEEESKQREEWKEQAKRLSSHYSMAVEQREAARKLRQMKREEAERAAREEDSSRRREEDAKLLAEIDAGCDSVWRALRAGASLDRTVELLDAVEGGTVARDDYADSLLHVASWEGRADVVHELLRSGADVNSIDSSCGFATPLHEAAEAGYLDVVELLLAAGGKTTAQNSMGDSPLHVAARRGFVLIVRALVQADTHYTSLAMENGLGQRPLHVAASYQVRRLLSLLEGKVKRVRAMQQRKRIAADRRRRRAARDDGKDFRKRVLAVTLATMSS